MTRSSARRGDVLLMVGTRKGGFLINSGDGRKTWNLSQPHFAGTPVSHEVYDPRTGSIYAAVNETVWGTEINVSHDLGASWTLAREQRKKLAQCPQNCWMVGSAKTAMRTRRFAGLPKWGPLM